MSDVVMDAMNAMAAERSGKAPDLSATGLVKVYGDRTVVSGMNVNCSCGEIVGILGPNGASSSSARAARSRRDIGSVSSIAITFSHTVRRRNTLGSCAR